MFSRILGSVIVMILGMYSVFGYLDPWGKAPCSSIDVKCMDPQGYDMVTPKRPCVNYTATLSL